MRIATIDVGTNTVLALDAQTTGGALVRQGDHLDIVRLGEGLDRSGRLAEAAMGRALAVLSRHGDRLRRSPPDVARAIATEAVRKADNAADFLERARRALGFPLEVIDGQREAQLSWLATSRSLPRAAGAPAGPRAVLEIGGGSTQLMIGRPDGLTPSAPSASPSARSGSPSAPSTATRRARMISAPWWPPSTPPSTVRP